MKRSEMNKRMREAVAFVDQMNFKLPPFAYWSPGDWKTKGSEYDEIRDNMLGWDITDFGSGDFSKVGLLLFTIRNGNLNTDKYIKPYAEKILIVEEEQVTPFHFHWNKMEDIINRGGGNLLVQVYNSREDGEFLDTPVQISTDGRAYTVEAGAILRITPGESITLPVGQYHKFWGEKGTGKVLIGEVSMVNDDRTDNRFYGEAGRFSEIEEDEAPLYLLGNEYPSVK
ncbi:D-lyxose/D-mannose family sugar isomerase [Paenibacillus sp. BR2-3]|uniref:D-lyxose/D-mannose family sugar isomerase n=1 Tax=Paenibacillus sp. BR2-3 TaxID=3048494 RepID=UPI0039772ABB